MTFRVSGEQTPRLFPVDLVPRLISAEDWQELGVGLIQRARALDAFLRERAASLEWLRGLHEPNWDATYHARWGVLRAGDLLAAWLAHDHLHVRQLNELHYAYLAQQAAPYSVEYAGDW